MAKLLLNSVSEVFAVSSYFKCFTQTCNIFSFLFCILVTGIDYRTKYFLIADIDEISEDMWYIDGY